MVVVAKEVINRFRKCEGEGKYHFTAQLGDNVDAKVFLRRLDNEGIYVRAYLMTRSPSKRIEEIGEVSCTVRSVDTLDIDVRDLCNKLLKNLHDYRKSASSPPKRTRRDLAEKVMSIPNIMEPDNYRKYIGRREWGPDTTEDAVKYFANTIGRGVIDVYGDDASTDEIMEFVETEIDRIYDAKYQHPTKDGTVIKRRREDIYNGIVSRMARARVVQMYLIDNYPDEGWGTLLPLVPRYTTSSAEEIKAVTYEQYIKLCALVKRLCVAGYPLAFCALGEVCSGERVGESSAHLVGDFDLRETYGRCYINHQLDDHGVRTNKLKNIYSYRYVSFAGMRHEMILLRRAQLAAMGYTEDQYAMMPLGAYDDTPYEFIGKQKVSSFIRILLKMVGCDEKWLDKEAEKMFIAAKAGGDSEDVDVSAHLLRRTIATFLSNGGMSADDVDAVLGHKNEENKDTDYGSWDKAQELSAIMERAVTLGSLCRTSNPAYTPVPLSDNVDFQLMGNTCYQFYAEADSYLEIDVTSMEPEAGVSVMVPEPYRSTSFHLRNPVDTIISRRERPILPKLQSSEEVERWIREAEEIDLSMFIKGGGEIDES